MKTVNEFMGERKRGDILKMAERVGVDKRTLARWIHDESHYVNNGYVYKKVGKIDTSKQRD